MKSGHVVRLKIGDQKIHFEYGVVRTGRIPEGGCPRCAHFTCPIGCGGWKPGMPDILDFYIGMGVEGIRRMWGPGKMERIEMFKKPHGGAKMEKDYGEV